MICCALGVLDQDHALPTDSDEICNSYAPRASCSLMGRKRYISPLASCAKALLELRWQPSANEKYVYRYVVVKGVLSDQWHCCGKA